MEGVPLLKLQKLDKVFMAKAGLFTKPAAVNALSDVTLEVYPGESLGLVGESGSGKTDPGPDFMWP
ncbi:MAG: hypothetical protein U5L96_15810 [Owenweeksia sp.]|nr:hypothetical protein [Owenweeksia sp.]